MKEDEYMLLLGGGTVGFGVAYLFEAAFQATGGGTMPLANAGIRFAFLLLGSLILVVE